MNGKEMNKNAHKWNKPVGCCPWQECLSLCSLGNLSEGTSQIWNFLGPFN